MHEVASYFSVNWQENKLHSKDNGFLAVKIVSFKFFIPNFLMFVILFILTNGLVTYFQHKHVT